MIMMDDTTILYIIESYGYMGMLLYIHIIA